MSGFGIVPLVAYPLVAVTAMLALLVLPFFLEARREGPLQPMDAGGVLSSPLSCRWRCRVDSASASCGRSAERGPPRRSAAAIVAAAVICSAGMLATTVWLMPYSNQSFRVATGTPDRLTPTGAAELSLRELSEQIRTRAADGLPTRNP